jgi:putative DNA primase/helicase
MRKPDVNYTAQVIAVRDAARRAYTAGLCVLPPREDGSKAPEAVGGEWNQFKQVRATPEQMRGWYPGRSGLGVVAGPVSAETECGDFDCRETYDAFLKTAKATGLGSIVERIIAGFCDHTPGNGVRWLWRCPGAARKHNTKLARRPKRPEEQRDLHDTVKVLIELPDYAIVAPSNGKVHPTGGAYTRWSGDFDTIATITVEERTALIALARTFDQMPVAQPHEPKRQQPEVTNGTRPGEAFTARTTWGEVLEPHGWTAIYTRGATTYWRRPGKALGVSATTNHGGSDLLFMFSSSTVFEADKSYSRFGAYTILDHGGDFRAAARALAARGFGETSGPSHTKQVNNTTDKTTSSGVVETTDQGSVVLDPGDPLPSARHFVARSHLVDGVLAMRHQSGVFYTHLREVNAYRDRDEAAVRADLYGFLESALRWSEPRGTQAPTLGPFKPTKSKVENVLDALRAVCNLPASSAAPCWLQDDPGFDPFDVLACRDGLLHIPTRTLLPGTPHFFTLNGLDFAFDPMAPQPSQWLQFLNTIWPDDQDSKQTLQEWMGYLLTPRTHFQKILMLVGPKRSGKGTIGRVTRRLLGDRNVSGPTLASLGEQFGLMGLIGKSAAVISDARISGRTDTAIVTERLLSISGEDALSVPRKYLPDWTGKLSARFMVLTNELPRIEDASGALTSRFIVLTLAESFYGREDHGLFDRFLPELSGILNWALEGWDRLYTRGRFVQPQSAAELIQEFEDLGSPTGAFIRERCEVGKGYDVSKDRLFQAWNTWCRDNGREHAGTVQTFGRNLRALVPWLGESQPRVLGSRVRYYEGIRLREGGD